MKLVCLQENLKEGLNIAEKIVGKNLALPILSNLLLTAEKGRLKISATDLEIGINTWIPAKVVSEGSLTIPAKLLSNFINNLPAKQIEFETKANVLNVKCENFKAAMNGLDAKDYPIIPKTKKAEKIEINGQILKTAFLKTAFAAALKETRPEISGIFFKFNPKEIKIAATDSFRLAEKIILGGDFKSELSGSSIIPLRTVQELVRIIGEKNEQVKIIPESNQILFDMGETQLISRLIEGEYPNYEQIIPKDFETQTVLNKSDFINAVKLAGLFCGKTNDVKFFADTEKKILDIFSSQSDAGNSKSTLSVKKAKGKEITVVFNYKYVLDGLVNMQDEEVIFELNGEIKPGLVKSDQEQGYLYIFMPIKSA